ncbi:MAG: hypothetical protein PHX77_03150 [Candidatus Bipolaricaulis sp.]|nr:hypothetical protein [Candidatus Bipolaricaulis sp.]
MSYMELWILLYVMVGGLGTELLLLWAHAGSAKARLKGFLDEFPDARPGMRVWRVVSRVVGALVAVGLLWVLFGFHGSDAAQQSTVQVHAVGMAANLEALTSAAVSWHYGVAVLLVRWRLHGARGVPHAGRGLIALALPAALFALATTELVRAVT